MTDENEARIDGGCSGRAYKCPRCGGEFGVWETLWDGSERCPFCDLEKYSYDPDEDDRDQ